MAYGTNQPNGLVPYQLDGAPANPNMQYDENFSIASGYPVTIGKGDIVTITNSNTSVCATSLLQGLADPFTTGIGAVLGVFQGVYLDLPQSNQTQSSGWSDVWTAGTTTRTGFPATIKVIPVNQRWLFSVQSIGNPTVVPTPAEPYPLSLGQFMALQWVNVSTTSGQNVYTPNLDGSAPLGVVNATTSYNAGSSNLVQFMGYPKDSPNGTPQAGLKNGNVLVRLCNQNLPTVYLP